MYIHYIYIYIYDSVYTGLDDSRFQPCCVCTMRGRRLCAVYVMGKKKRAAQREREGIIEAKGGKRATTRGERILCVCVCVAGLMHTLPHGFWGRVFRRIDVKMAAAAAAMCTRKTERNALKREREKRSSLSLSLLLYTIY